MLAEAKKYFGHLKNDKKSRKIQTTEAQSSPHAQVKHKVTDQTHFVLGFRAYDAFIANPSGIMDWSGICRSSSTRSGSTVSGMGRVLLLITCLGDTAASQRIPPRRTDVRGGNVDEIRLKLKKIQRQCEQLSQRLIPDPRYDVS
jgi:hypothetical protein